MVTAARELTNAEEEWANLAVLAEKIATGKWTAHFHRGLGDGASTAHVYLEDEAGERWWAFVLTPIPPLPMDPYAARGIVLSWASMLGEVELHDRLAVPAVVHE